MEARDPRPNPEGMVTQDDDGLLMKMDPNPSTDHKETLSVTCDRRPQDQTTVTPPASEVNTPYRETDDVGTGDVFIQQSIPPSPSYMAPLMPLEGSMDRRVNNSTLTPANGAADATEAKANPDGLDWHHGERQLMAAQNKLDELVASSAQTSEESVDTANLSKDKESSLSKDSLPMEGQGHLAGMYYDPSGGHHKGNTSENDKSPEEPEDIEIRKNRAKLDNWRESESNHPSNQVLSTHEEISDKEVFFQRDGERKKSDPSAETQSKQTKTNSPLKSNSRMWNEDSKSCKQPEPCKKNQNSKEKDTNPPRVSKIASEESNDDDEHVDTSSLNYRLAKHDWVRRESEVGENLAPRLSMSESSVESVSRGELAQGSKRISTNIQQGEQLLQRLQLVQQRQDVQVQENPPTSQQVVQEMRGERDDGFETEVEDMKARDVDLADVDEREESVFQSVEDGGSMVALMEKESTEGDGCDGNLSLSPPIMPVKPEHYPIYRTESGESEDSQSSVWRPEWSSIDEMTPTQIPLVSSRPRLSVAETSLEKQMHEEAQKKQNLQRAGGVFNLADNLDVIEIPFKTNFSLEPLPAKVGTGQRVDRQFSEQKMQKEISQEIQRELVMVNQGKIPGAYSKGEVRQLKETKLLFEAFQQENMAGPTRHRKSPTTLTKGHVYPSVLERTRSLERFSLKSIPLSKTHSLTGQEPNTSQMKNCPEDFRSKSPNGGSRDKIRSSPYLKQDKHSRQYRSMDLISSGVPTVETRIQMMEGSMSQESPILKHNPFFKLRPARVLQPEVEKDIREAREREEELRRQRCTLYGENRWKSKDRELSRFTPANISDSTGQSRGKLERSWPPPSKKEQKWEHTQLLTQQEAKVRRTGGQKASLWQRWESGQINGQPPKEKD